MRSSAAFILLILVLCSAGCGNGAENDVVSTPETTGTSVPGGETVSLPQPVAGGGMPLAEALNRHRSCRTFADVPLSISEVGQLLWACGGKRVDAVSGATRTAPSAGGIYPLRYYVVSGEVEGLPSGVYLYDPASHALATLAAGDRREDLARTALGQDFIADAPASVVLAVDYEKVQGRYGERGIRYAHLDAGCASQNLALQAAAEGLGTVVVGAFNDQGIAEILGSDETPLAILPIGHPI